MNLLLLIGTYCDFGGTEKVVTLMANDLVESCPDCSVTIAAFRKECDPQKFGLSPKVLCVSLSGNGRSATCNLRQLLLDRKVDVIVNHWCLPFYVTRTINKARKGLPIRLISILEGVPDRCKKVIVAEDRVRAARGIGRLIAKVRLCALQFAVKASIRYVYRQSDRYLVISKGFMESFRSYTGLKDLSRLDYIYPLTDFMDTGEVVLSNKKRQIVYVGRMDKENKRVNRILAAWAAVANDHPDWSLVLVGGGPHLDELREEAVRHSIPRVTMTGFIQEAPSGYYRDSAIFMLTSDLEGFGLVLVEAMSYGVVPIVYNSYVTAREIVDDGVNGFLTPAPYSHETTVDCLRRLMEDDSLRQRMANAAVEKAKIFSQESIMEKWKVIIGRGDGRTHSFSG